MDPVVRTGNAEPSERYRNGCALQPTAIQPVDHIKARLHRDKFVRLCLEFMERFADAHLKFLVADELSDRRRMRVSGRELWNFGCDSFLGLDRHPRVQRAMIDAFPCFGTHNGASRAFSSVALCEEAERRLANWLGVADTLIFPTVTLANLGLLPALTGRGALLVVDRSSHDSVQQGAKLAQAGGAELCELNPCRADVLNRLLKARDRDGCLVAVDGVYSMTGGTPPLADLNVVAQRYRGCLYVDDAHGTGVTGPAGRGAAAAALGHLEQALMVGSLSKAFSCLGAFVTCDPELKLMLKLRSSTFVFGGPVPPPYLAGVCAATDIIASTEGDTLRSRLRGLISRLTHGIHSLDMAMSGGGESPIVSVILGEIETALVAGKWLFDRGFYVQSAHYPAVPINGSLLRIQVNANHPPRAIDELLNALSDMKKALKLATSEAYQLFAN
jgi:7-keto-8-aminopelargonate synthetase-like enzyme